MYNVPGACIRSVSALADTDFCMGFNSCLSWSCRLSRTSSTGDSSIIRSESSSNLREPKKGEENVQRVKLSHMTTAKIKTKVCQSDDKVPSHRSR